MEKIPVRLTDKARAEFLAWIDSVKAPNVSSEACLAELESELENNQRHYELGPHYTRSGNPATIGITDAELVFEDLDAGSDP